jgi:hypothetical protein
VRLSLLVLAATVVLGTGYVVYKIDPRNKLIKSLAIAGSAEKAKSNLDEYSAPEGAASGYSSSEDRARAALQWDFLFLVCYTIAIFMGTRLARWREGRLRSMTNAAGIAILLVAMVDVVENSVLLRFLSSGTAVGMQVLPFLYWFKLVAFVACALCALTSGVVWAWKGDGQAIQPDRRESRNLTTSGLSKNKL